MAIMHFIVFNYFYWFVCLLPLVFVLSVTFNEDDPKEGYARLIFEVKEMVVKKILFGGGWEAKNAEVSASFTDGYVT